MWPRRAAAAGGEVISTELLFVDVQRQLIALHEVLSPEAVVRLVSPLATAEQVRRRLGELLHPAWTDAGKRRRARNAGRPDTETNKREHKSAYRLIQEYRLAQRNRVQT